MRAAPSDLITRRSSILGTRRSASAPSATAEVENVKRTRNRAGHLRDEVMGESRWDGAIGRDHRKAYQVRAIITAATGQGNDRRGMFHSPAEHVALTNLKRRQRSGVWYRPRK